MERELRDPQRIAADLGDGKHGDFAERFAAEGLEQIADYLAKWAAYRDFAGDE